MSFYFDATGTRHELSALITGIRIRTGVTPLEAEHLHLLAAGERVLEVGSWYGYSTVVMAQSARMVVAVDHHRGDADAGFENTLTAFLENLQRYRVAARVVPLVGGVEEAARFLPDGYFGLVFIDAAHDRASVARDIELCWPKVALHGTMAFHDYGRFEVSGPVDALARGTQLRHADSLAWLVKR